MPWLQEPCDRKNSLYSNFVKTPTTENKDIYTKMKKWVDKQIFTRKKKGARVDKFKRKLQMLKDSWKL